MNSNLLKITFSNQDWIRKFSNFILLHGYITILVGRKIFHVRVSPSCSIFSRVILESWRAIYLLHKLFSIPVSTPRNQDFLDIKILSPFDPHKSFIKNPQMNYSSFASKLIFYLGSSHQSSPFVNRTYFFKSREN